MTETIGDKVPTMKVARGLLITPARELLLVRRIAKNGEDKGQLELPGGKYEPTDNFVSALQREVEEEMGIRVKPLGTAKRVECRVLEKRSGSPYSGFKVTWVSRAANVGGTLQPQTDEVSEILPIYVPELSQYAHELTEPTKHALGFFGLHGYGNIDIPDLTF
jgi:8-oxo-dGTP pyrophosphatase MutT (NUDIX family)